MSNNNIVVVIFDGEDTAHEVREELRKLQKAGQLDLDDAAVVYKDAKGKVHVKNEVQSGVKVGAVGGGALGLLLAVMFPVVGIAIGAVAGAIIGRMVDEGVDKTFIKEVSDALTPGKSALFVLTKSANPNAVRGALEPFHGTIYHTSLDPEVEEELRNALK